MNGEVYAMKKRYDAILLLGLKLNEDGSAKPELTLRIQKAAQCYHRGLAPLIIPCGGQTPGTPVTEASVMEAALLRLNVPSGAILKEDRSQITVENMLNARAVLNKADPRVLIVTSHYHTLRARLTCRRSAHMRADSCRAHIPSHMCKKALRLEPLHLIDYLLGYQDSGKVRPRWYLTVMYALGIPKPQKKPDR